MIGWISKLVGPRVLVGVLLAAGAALLFVGASWRLAASNLTEVRSDLDDAERALESAERAQEAVALALNESRRLQREAEARRVTIERAKDDAPKDIRDCGDVVLTPALADGLRIELPGRAAGDPDGPGGDSPAASR